MNKSKQAHKLSLFWCVPECAHSPPPPKKPCFCIIYSTSSGYTELPKKLKSLERKPWVTDINEIKRKSRLENQDRSFIREAALKPPENGLLVKELIPVDHDVFAARTRLLSCVSRVSIEIPIFHTWGRGGPNHVFPVVDSFHLYDRLGRAVSHNERLEVDRIPAIVELCIQAGVEIQEYPTRRRDFPIYRVAGRIIDFEKKFPKNDFSGKGINIKPFGFWEMDKRRREDRELSLDLPYDDLKAMPRVGPKGHRVRQCQAFKHQMRDGQHAWQQATFDDLVPPVYVWHVADKPLVVDGLKRYYGMLPALVEFFAQGGAQIAESYRSVMREDVVVPTLDEEKLVV
ncbi:hypothetical protein CASFOL_005533 [Castilleja foliolosa]|uniref:APO domain-containing protein n=1 Tax=Castilleja foliolosa TaxID=1961234 RepID=A0ABD3E3P6_9LAMI